MTEIDDKATARIATTKRNMVQQAAILDLKMHHVSTTVACWTTGTEFSLLPLLRFGSTKRKVNTIVHPPPV